MNLKSLILLLPLAVGLSACGGGGYYDSRRAEADYLADRGERLEDAALTSKVAAMMTDDRSLNGSEIHVSTFGNTVQLTGYVASRRDAIHAEDLALNIPGVRDVENRLSVRP